jgi:hypothetical protein
MDNGCACQRSWIGGLHNMKRAHSSSPVLRSLTVLKFDVALVVTSGLPGCFFRTISLARFEKHTLYPRDELSRGPQDPFSWK